MIRLLRYLFLPTVAFLVIAGLAWAEWSKVLECKRAAETFHKNSELLVFEIAGEGEWKGRSFPIYGYDLGGVRMEFPTHSEIELPADGRVRMGLDPFPRKAPRFSVSPPPGELVVPINGPDTAETIYEGLRGHKMSEDLTKASVVSVAAIIAGFAGFFLQRIIFRDVKRAFRSR